MTEKIPDSLPSCLLDMMNDINSIAYVPQIHMLLDFDGRIDPERLRRALRLCLDAEPVLGCRWVRRWFRPYWKRLTEEELNNRRILGIVYDNHPDQLHTEEFCAESMDETNGPQIKALLICGKRRDRLIIKVNHMAADAGGTKEIGYLLASIYRRLQEDPDYSPIPNCGPRGLWQIYSQFLPSKGFTFAKQYIKDIRSALLPRKSLALSLRPENSGPPVFVFKRLSKSRVREIKQRGGDSGATVNDMLAAGVMRALARQMEWDGNGAARLVQTIDLRRYLPERKGNAVTNLSSFFFPCLKREIGAEFNDTLERVKNRIDTWKSDHPGLGYLYGSYFFLLPYPYFLKKIVVRQLIRMAALSNNVPMGLTNMGRIDHEALDFGFPFVEHAELVVPAAHHPLFAVGVSGYNGTITLTTGFHETVVSRAVVEEFFTYLDEELTFGEDDDEPETSDIQVHPSVLSHAEQTSVQHACKPLLHNPHRTPKTDHY